MSDTARKVSWRTRRHIFFKKEFVAYFKYQFDVRLQRIKKHLQIESVTATAKYSCIRYVTGYIVLRVTDWLTLRRFIVFFLESLEAKFTVGFVRSSQYFTFKYFPNILFSTQRSVKKKWNTKDLTKLENHNNELVVNLLDNSETTHIDWRDTPF
jgi:hypothetical protein